MGIFIEKPIPFIREAFQHIAALDYPKSRIDVFIHSTVSDTDGQ